MNLNEVLNNELSLGKKLGMCIKNQEEKVLFQNDTSIKTCGPMVGQVCNKTCNALCKKISEYSAVSPGMHVFKDSELEGQKVDIMIVNDGDRITTLLYLLEGQEEQKQKQEAFFREKGLTKSELRIMNMVLEGHTNAVIAEKLFISKATLKTHLNNIYKKLPDSMRPSQGRA
ncbi:MAG: two-component response regulator-like protein [Bdellovibrio sp. ArHS]|uniref:helix-turn-helix domain-containing protein n=1 Tax=Bdellovibrio sp. ArHS TaxID=1569284 RepID=UPI00058268A4|nr:helix-turn-helix transcriptional regulator [Bdellovibrio sp. ArHS]KHD87133.1 MAG: two-component response regulator-like protein [Bdellovibrio sp. ArHS]